MARKLKSDKVLFTATLLLVALSVVMVYSASAPMALDRYGRATRFLTTQAMWAVLGIAMLTVLMRIDYRYYREPVLIWTGLAFVAFALVAIGEARPLLREALGDVVRVEEADSLADAIARAHELAKPSGVVLLAPACASFDMFRDYAERGRIFKEEVRKLV